MMRAMHADPPAATLSFHGGPLNSSCDAGAISSLFRPFSALGLSFSVGLVGQVGLVGLVALVRTHISCE